MRVLPAQEVQYELPAHQTVDAVVTDRPIPVHPAGKLHEPTVLPSEQRPELGGRRRTSISVKRDHAGPVQPGLHDAVVARSDLTPLLVDREDAPRWVR
jgi:hypothetical protein